MPAPSGEIQLEVWLTHSDPQPAVTANEMEIAHRKKQQRR